MTNNTPHDQTTTSCSSPPTRQHWIPAGRLSVALAAIALAAAGGAVAATALEPSPTPSSPGPASAVPGSHSLPASGSPSRAAGSLPKTGAAAGPAVSADPAASSDPAAFYAGRAMAGNGDSAVSLAKAESLANEIPAGAQVGTTDRTIRFTARDVCFVVVASPPSADMKFRTAGIDDPTIEVPAGARVTVEFINGDSDMAHMWILGAGAGSQSGVDGNGAVAAARPLGDPTAAGQPLETITFTAPAAGEYHYYCAFPGHAAQGMLGHFEVLGR